MRGRPRRLRIIQKDGGPSASGRPPILRGHRLLRVRLDGPATTLEAVGVWQNGAVVVTAIVSLALAEAEIFGRLTGRTFSLERVVSTERAVEWPPPDAATNAAGSGRPKMDESLMDVPVTPFLGTATLLSLIH